MEILANKALGSRASGPRALLANIPTTLNFQLGNTDTVSLDIRRYQAISGNIGRKWAMSEDIGVISSGVKSVMYWARPIQVVLGQVFFS